MTAQAEGPMPNAAIVDLTTMPDPGPVVQQSILVARRLDDKRARGILGGLLVLGTGHNPFQAYWDIVKGAGLNWLAHPTNTDVANTAAYNFSQTLLQTTSLILTGLAVAFAFRCGMFNIGGNGQYLVGLYVANWIGISFLRRVGLAWDIKRVTLGDIEEGLVAAPNGRLIAPELAPSGD